MTIRHNSWFAESHFKLEANSEINLLLDEETSARFYAEGI